MEVKSQSGILRQIVVLLICYVLTRGATPTYLDDTHPLTFTNWEPCTWLGVAVSELVVIGYKGFLIIGCLVYVLSCLVL